MFADAVTLPLLAATVTSGVLTGAYALYAHTVMPGLRSTPDATFVEAFAALDRAILNPWFIGGAFLGAPLTTALALVTSWGASAAPWVAAALALHLVATGVTVAVHVPRNDALKAFVPGGDAHVVRAAFDEARWARWNLLRVAVSLLAFGALATALTLAGG